MRIGVNALYLIPGGVGGTEIYLRGLLAALAGVDTENEYFVFTNRETAGGLPPKAVNFHTVEQPVRAASRAARILWEQTAIPLAAARLRLDVLFNPGFTAPLACPCPQVTVLHDLQHKRHPEHFRWFDLPFWRFLLYWSAHVSRLLIAVSDATAADLKAIYRLPESRVRVVPSGVDAEFFEIARRRPPEPNWLMLSQQPCKLLEPKEGSAHVAPNPFLLAVSTLHPHKNLDRLLRAFAEFHREQPEYRLVVCGMHGFFTGPLHELRAALGLGDAVDFPGWIPRADLHDLYERASAFLYPSTFEGFGLPVLEALAAGVPSACSNIEPLSSLAGDAALQFDPGDIGAMTESMRRLVDDADLRVRLADAGPRRAAEFSWRATAEGTLQALRDAAR